MLFLLENVSYNVMRLNLYVVGGCANEKTIEKNLYLV